MEGVMQQQQQQQQQQDLSAELVARLDEAKASFDVKTRLYCLEQVRELCLHRRQQQAAGDVQLLTLAVPEIAGFQVDRSAKVRLFVLRFLEDAFKLEQRRGGSGGAGAIAVLEPFLQTVIYRVQDEAVAVATKAVLALANALKHATRAIVSYALTHGVRGAAQAAALWERLGIAKRTALGRMRAVQGTGSDENDDATVQVAVLRLAQNVVVLDTPANAAAGDDSSVFGLHSIRRLPAFVRLDVLRAEADQLVERLILQLKTVRQRAAVTMCTNALLAIAQARDGYTTRITTAFADLIASTNQGGDTAPATVVSAEQRLRKRRRVDDRNTRNLTSGRPATSTAVAAAVAAAAAAATAGTGPDPQAGELATTAAGDVDVRPAVLSRTQAMGFAQLCLRRVLTSEKQLRDGAASTAADMAAMDPTAAAAIQQQGLLFQPADVLHRELVLRSATMLTWLESAENELEEREAENTLAVAIPDGGVDDDVFHDPTADPGAEPDAVTLEQQQQQRAVFELDIQLAQLAKEHQPAAGQAEQQQSSSATAAEQQQRSESAGQDSPAASAVSVFTGPMFSVPYSIFVPPALVDVLSFCAERFVVTHTQDSVGENNLLLLQFLATIYRGAQQRAPERGELQWYYRQYDHAVLLFVYKIMSRLVPDELNVSLGKALGDILMLLPRIPLTCLGMLHRLCDSDAKHVRERALWTVGHLHREETDSVAGWLCLQQSLWYMLSPRFELRFQSVNMLMTAMRDSPQLQEPLQLFAATLAFSIVPMDGLQHLEATFGRGGASTGGNRSATDSATVAAAADAAATGHTAMSAVEIDVAAPDVGGGAAAAAENDDAALPLALSSVMSLAPLWTFFKLPHAAVARVFQRNDLWHAQLRRLGGTHAQAEDEALRKQLGRALQSGSGWRSWWLSPEFARTGVAAVQTQVFGAGVGDPLWPTNVEAAEEAGVEEKEGEGKKQGAGQAEGTQSDGKDDSGKAADGGAEEGTTSATDRVSAVVRRRVGLCLQLARAHEGSLPLLRPVVGAYMVADAGAKAPLADENQAVAKVTAAAITSEFVSVAPAIAQSHGAAAVLTVLHEAPLEAVELVLRIVRCMAPKVNAAPSESFAAAVHGYIEEYQRRYERRSRKPSPEAAVAAAAAAAAAGGAESATTTATATATASASTAGADTGEQKMEVQAASAEEDEDQDAEAEAEAEVEAEADGEGDGEREMSDVDLKATDEGLRPDSRAGFLTTDIEEPVGDVSHLWTPKRVRCLFSVPILAGFSTEDALVLLPELLELEKNDMDEAFARLTSTQPPVLSKAGLLTTLHCIDPARHGYTMRTVSAAIQSCIMIPRSYSQDVWQLVFDKLSQEKPPPVPTLRTVIVAMKAWPELRSFVASTVLPRLLSQPLWETSPSVWRGVPLVLARIAVHRGELRRLVPYMLRLPPAALQPLLEQAQVRPILLAWLDVTMKAIREGRQSADVEIDLHRVRQSGSSRSAGANTDGKADNEDGQDNDRWSETVVNMHALFEGAEGEERRALLERMRKA